MAQYDRAILERVMRPTGEARGLPNTFHVDDATFETEKTQVFFKN